MVILNNLLSRLLKQSIVRYLLVGATAFVAEYTSFYFMYFSLNLPLYGANSLSFILGLTTSFTLNKVWTFGNSDHTKRTTHQLGLYISLAFINLLLTNILVGWLVYSGLSAGISKLAAMIITSLWNFVIYRQIIFKTKRDETQSD